jgi:hypothetical protein
MWGKANNGWRRKPKNYETKPIFLAESKARQIGFRRSAEHSATPGQSAARNWLGRPGAVEYYIRLPGYLLKFPRKNKEIGAVSAVP